MREGRMPVYSISYNESRFQTVTFICKAPQGTPKLHINLKVAVRFITSFSCTYLFICDNFCLSEQTPIYEHY